MAIQTDVQIGDASFAVEVGAIYPHGAGPWGDVRLREIGGGRDVGGFIWPLSEPFLISLARWFDEHAIPAAMEKALEDTDA